MSDTDVVDDLKLIKKYFGENMMRLCRELFPTILDEPGKLFEIIDSGFNRSRFLHDDIVKSEDTKTMFKNFINAEFNKQKSTETHKNDVLLSPKELMAKAGYKLIECHTNDDVLEFKKYYHHGEELCTFHDEHRIDRFHIFFAIKESIEEIKRENFFEPKREDEYGTSLICLQFSKGESNTLSIKNRYNHSVTNPDATFGNNLENIIPGLTKSFEKYYNFNINQVRNEFELDDYVLATDGKYYKYNHEINNIHYCPDNIIIDNYHVITKYAQNPERYIVADYFIIDTQEKTVEVYDKDNIYDSFVDDLKDIKKINVEKDKADKTKKIEIIKNDGTMVSITIDKCNRITKYVNESCREIGDNFLYCNDMLSSIVAPNVEKIGDNFLKSNYNLTSIDLPNVRIIGDDFLYVDYNLEFVNIPNVLSIGDSFLNDACAMKHIDLPNVTHIGKNFMSHASELKTANLPKVICVGSQFMFHCFDIEDIFAPSLENIDNGFIAYGIYVSEINLPNAKNIGPGFMLFNKNLKEVYLPSAEIIETGFLNRNECVEKIVLPKEAQISNNFKHKDKIMFIERRDGLDGEGVCR